jgi:two-component system response regulator AtoC
VLSARLEALRLLADRVTNRVMVVDRDFTVIYANHSAWSGDESPGQRPAKCFEAILHRADPCAHCAAQAVFESGEVRSVSCSTRGMGEQPTCGMVQAFPLMAARGETEAVLVLFNNPEPRPPAGPSGPEAERAGPERLGDLISCTATMRQLFDMLRMVADSQATVLLQGESGTGKELVAKTIHRLSHRRDRPFVVVDCGSLPATLLESELFGHVKGAFTGAVVSKKGLFEEADGGTILLDEIADTTPHFQAKLLRVLQEGEIKPVGSSRSIKVNVRVISATNRDLIEQVNAKQFREDLYYRLAVLPLYLPPLRERKEDIPLLVRHFVAASCVRHRKPLLTVTDEAMHALVEAPWPGNIRQLQHMIERAVVTASGEALGPEDFLGAPSIASPRDLRTVARGAVQQAERARILEVLQQVGGNRSKAAKVLKISRANLYNKLHAYKIH